MRRMTQYGLALHCPSLPLTSTLRSRKLMPSSYRNSPAQTFPRTGESGAYLRTEYCSRAIARPNLIPNLFAAVNEQMQIKTSTGTLNQRQSLILLRSLELLNKVLKEFANIKVLPGIQSMLQVTSLVFSRYPTFDPRGTKTDDGATRNGVPEPLCSPVCFSSIQYGSFQLGARPEGPSAGAYTLQMFIENVQVVMEQIQAECL